MWHAFVHLSLVSTKYVHSDIQVCNENWLIFSLWWHIEMHDDMKGENDTVMSLSRRMPVLTAISVRVAMMSVFFAFP